MSEPLVNPIPENRIQDVYNLLVSDETCQFLQRVLGFIPSIFDIRRHTRGDPDFRSDLLLGAYIDEQLVGSILGIHRPWKTGKETTGYLKWIFIKGEYRRLGIGRLLVDNCEQKLRSCGCVKLLYGSCSPVYLFPGVPKEDSCTQYFLDTLGWRQISERISLNVNVPSACIDSNKVDSLSNVPKFLSLGVADTNEKKRFLLEFIKREFSLSWALESCPAIYKDDTGLCCYVSEKESGKIYGFAAIGTANPCWFGPMGVKSDERMHGVGRFLVQHSLVLAQKQGIIRLMFSWVNDAEAFYRKVLGPAVSRHVFLKYEKNY